MHRGTSALLLSLTAAVAVAAGGTSAAAAGATETKVKCRTAALSRAPKLPAGFPKPHEVTYTSAKQAGPSLIVQGYFAADLDEALAEYKDAVRSAHYTDLKTEHDAHDAEINYKGGGTTGQIALRETCTEARTTLVQITSRPGSGGTTGGFASLPTKLQTAAQDLVRETSNRDKEGSRRAFTALEAAFGRAQEQLREKAPAQEATIDRLIESVDSALKAGDLRKANGFSVTIEKAVEAAAAKIAGGTGGTAKGAKAVVQGLKAAARDLDQEAGFKDKEGTQRSLTSFTKAFNAGRKQIEAASPQAEETIMAALERVAAAVKGGSTGKIHTATTALVKAVDAAGKLVGS